MASTPTARTTVSLTQAFVIFPVSPSERSAGPKQSFRFRRNAGRFVTLRLRASMGQGSRSSIRRGGPFLTLPGVTQLLTASTTVHPPAGVERPAFRAGDVHGARKEVGHESAAAEDGHDEENLEWRSHEERHTLV